MLNDLETVRWLLPEIVLIAIATLITVGGAFRRHGPLWLSIALAGYLAAAILLLVLEGQHWGAGLDPVLTGPLVADYLGYMLRLLTVFVGAIFTLVLSRNPGQRLHSEILGLWMFAVVGAMLAARANELVFLFLGLELVSIPTYALLFIGGRGRAAAESAAKYFYLSVLSSAVLLYGLSFVYGAAGTTWLSSNSTPNPEEIASIRVALHSASGSASLLGLALVVAGLGFKIAAAPFHFYAPDVYQGTSNANAAILSVAPKIAGFAALIRVVVVAMSGFSDFAWQVALVLAVLTMTIGNVCALWQKNVRRLMAYSSIAHAGYMLIGVAAACVPSGTNAIGGTAALVYYLCVYALATAGFFATLTYLSGDDQNIDAVDQLAGLGAQQPVLAAIITVCMFSLAGLPPLAGFWGKLTLFTSALGVALDDTSSPLAPWFITLAVLGALNAAVAAAYYLRIVGVMYFRSSSLPIPRPTGGRAAITAAGICAVLVMLFGIYQAPLARWSGQAERSLKVATKVLDREPSAYVTTATARSR